jgi:putative SOS response-associated peptidase YedK
MPDHVRPLHTALHMGRGVFLSVFGTPRNLQPHYNIAPTTTIDVLRPGKEGRELVPMRWGLIPGWWKKSVKEVPATFNARAESVAEKPRRLQCQIWFRTRREILHAYLRSLRAV